MIHVPLLVLALNRLAFAGAASGTADSRWRRRNAWRAGAAAGACPPSSPAPWLPPPPWSLAAFWQYRHAGSPAGLGWTAEAQRHWGASLLSYLQPSDSNLYADLWPRALFRPENCLFPGWLYATGLCLAGLVLWRHRGSRGPRSAGGGDPRLRLLWRLGRLAALALVALGWSDAELWTWSEAPDLGGLRRAGSGGAVMACRSRS